VERIRKAVRAGDGVRGAPPEGVTDSLFVAMVDYNVDDLCLRKSTLSTCMHTERALHSDCQLLHALVAQAFPHDDEALAKFLNELMISLHAFPPESMKWTPLQLLCMFGHQRGVQALMKLPGTWCTASDIRKAASFALQAGSLLCLDELEKSPVARAVGPIILARC